MREELLKQLKNISEEERNILSQNKIDRSLYTTQSRFDIDSEKLLSLGKYIAARPHTRFTDFPLHRHNYIEIMYVCSGEITHVIDGKTITMSAGDLLFMNRNVSHCIQKTGFDDIGINFIILPEFFDIPLVMLKEDRNNALADFLIGALRIDEKRPQYLHFRTAGNHAIENLMENIISSLMSGKGEENINQFTMGLIFLQLLSNIETISDDSLLSGFDMMADTALRYINTRYQDASLTELAASMHQSPSNMSKIIKKSTGHTFSELLQKKRFQQAVVFLEDTKMTVSEIMNAVGYENSSHFYRLFREHYGLSPREYRLKNK
ncbi:MAG: helix-turn-helix domain-containing protein [Ruminococcaceae bacterium]|nr:helix-turn-helix domain-containing protein [Oscillospiraceae bacterium]